jgi:hypothetical protein
MPAERPPARTMIVPVRSTAASTPPRVAAETGSSASAPSDPSTTSTGWPADLLDAKVPAQSVNAPLVRPAVRRSSRSPATCSGCTSPFRSVSRRSSRLRATRSRTRTGEARGVGAGRRVLRVAARGRERLRLEAPGPVRSRSPGGARRRVDRRERPAPLPAHNLVARRVFGDAWMDRFRRGREAANVERDLDASDAPQRPIVGEAFATGRDRLPPQRFLWADHAAGVSAARERLGHPLFPARSPAAVPGRVSTRHPHATDRWGGSAM